MSDLRNFYGSDNSDIRIVEPVERVEPVAYQQAVYQSDIDGDRAEPLGAFHTIEVEETSNTGRIVGGLAIALMLGAAGIYGYEVSTKPAKPVATQTAANVPAPAPAAMPAPAPAQSADATPAATAAPAALQPAPAAPAAMAPAAASTPVTKAPVHTARTQVRSAPAAAAIPSSPASSGAPEQAAVQPVYPTAPSSSQALNNAQPIVTPDVQPSAAAPDQAAPQPPPEQPAQPVPAQPAPAPDQSGQPVQ